MYEHVVLLSVWKEFGVLTCHMPHNLQKPKSSTSELNILQTLSHLSHLYNYDPATFSHLVPIQCSKCISAPLLSSSFRLRGSASAPGCGATSQNVAVSSMLHPCATLLLKSKNSASSWKRLLQALKIKHTKDIQKLNVALVCSATFYNKCELQDGDLARGWRPAPFWEHVQTQQMWCGKTRKLFFSRSRFSVDLLCCGRRTEWG